MDRGSAAARLRESAFAVQSTTTRVEPPISGAIGAVGCMPLTAGNDSLLAPRFVERTSNQRFSLAECP